MVVVWVFARRWLGSREAAASAAVLALSPLVYIQAREAELDMLLATLTALSLCLLFEALESRRLGLFVAGAAALAGATMTKGPVPLAIAATAVVPFLVWTRRHRWGCWRGLAVGAVVLVALVVPVVMVEFVLIIILSLARQIRHITQAHFPRVGGLILQITSQMFSIQEQMIQRLRRFHGIRHHSQQGQLFRFQ
mgnify:CR=1 FL=1